MSLYVPSRITFSEDGLCLLDLKRQVWSLNAKHLDRLERPGTRIGSGPLLRGGTEASLLTRGRTRQGL